MTVLKLDLARAPGFASHVNYTQVQFQLTRIVNADPHAWADKMPH
jgi:hypothetical protein